VMDIDLVWIELSLWCGLADEHGGWVCNSLNVSGEQRVVEAWLRERGLKGKRAYMLCVRSCCKCV
jgi:hypothetical protein